MGEEELQEDHEPRFMKDMAEKLDTAFGFETKWYYDDSMNGYTKFVHGTSTTDEKIVVNTGEMTQIIRGARVDRQFEPLCYFFVMAHEKAHAHQAKRDRDNGLDPIKSYAANSVKYELEADRIAGYLHLENQLYYIGQRAQRRQGIDIGVQFYAFTACDDDMLRDVLGRLIQSMGDPKTHGTGETKTHGTGETRVVEFFEGRAWLARALTYERKFTDLFPDFLKNAGEHAGIISIE